MTHLSQLAEQIAGKLPAVSVQSRLYMRAVAEMPKPDAAERLADWVRRSADRDALIGALAAAYIEKIVRADVVGREVKSNVRPIPESPQGHSMPAVASDAGEASYDAPEQGHSRVASPATTLHDGRDFHPAPLGQNLISPAVAKPNPPRSTPATTRLVQSDADRAYFKTFLVRDVPIGEIRLGTAKTMAAQNEREARILRICIDYAGGSDDGLRLDEIVPPRVLADAIRSNGGGRHV